MKIKNNPSEAKQVKCTIDFRESSLNGADPVLKGDLIPIRIGENGKVTKADEKNGWYNYENKEWANAIIPTSEAKDTVKGYEVGHEIQESQIESYFVWIPKYSYRLFSDNLGDYASATKAVEKGATTAIEIRFGTGNTEDNDEECKTPMLDNGVQGESGGKGNCSVGKWMTHPAFLAFNTTGLWVGKFEAHNGGSGNIQIKPNATMWGNISIENIFNYSKDYKIDLQSHMIKNTEWGAVAYLTQSIYGKCEKKDGTTTCTEISSNDNSKYITGYSGTSIPYENMNSVASSTTGNYTGIYDMSGGIWENTASVMLDSTNKIPTYKSSGLNEKTLTDLRYFDVYKYSSDREHWNRRILGDATGELGPFTLSSYWYSSFFGDDAGFINDTGPWVVRGGQSGAQWNGIFALGCWEGSNTRAYGFRVILAP